MSDSLLDLLAAPPTPPLAVDELAVYAGGRARVRRRTWLLSGLTAATCVAVAGLGWSALPRTGPTSDLRPGGTDTTGRAVNCSDMGKRLGDSGPVRIGSATVSLRVDVATCDGTRVGAGFTEAGHAESIAFGHTGLTSKHAVFTVVGTADMTAPTGQLVALVVLPAGQRVCGWSHSGRPDDNLLPSMAPARSQTWTRGWTFVAQPLPSDAKDWSWRLHTCAPDGSSLSDDLVPLAKDPDEPAYASTRPAPVQVALVGGDVLSVGTPSPDTGSVPLTVTSSTGRILAQDTFTPDQKSRSALADADGGMSASFAPWRVGDHSLFVMLTSHGITGSDASWPSVPPPRITTMRTVPVPGTTERLAVFDAQDASGGPASPPAAAPTLSGSFDPQ